MSHINPALRATMAAALMSTIACMGTATANADANDTLAGALSKGYTSSNCKPQQPSEVQGSFNATVLAVLQCGQNSDSSGPMGGKYFLFGNSADTASSFTKLISGDTLANCGSASSPTTWHQGSNTDSAGQVACGTDSGKAEVLWTVDAKNVLAFIRASDGDTASLYKWWQANG
ncbi:serine/threonine protein kinase [Mycobacterium shigaense]|uniref:Uncharacterized protein n=1 Tax=Mycobacterium shigaense TaxID=722731 RepID=A0A1Z4ECU2_9MYCO|nr:serine/threonine protein kinase [Mycobacterium shigaense]MEA1122348.1 serine/threonine protein kinase [Mycobacterium shigaense]PRI17017.1 hypothetical protein B2J96_00675 [Mycobacterium shigaense]BAX90785.1 hypothetical protein MSG_00621 [Mycobacterium shigaense]